MDDETQWEHASPEVQARFRASFERQGLMRHLGARIVHIAPGRVHIVLPERSSAGDRNAFEIGEGCRKCRVGVRSESPSSGIVSDRAEVED